MAVDVEIKNEKTFIAKEYVKMVCRGYTYATCIIGPGGNGKTHLIMSVLDKEGENKSGEPYAFYGGHITPATIYEFLYFHRNQVIFFDDCSAISRKRPIIEMLKQACWGSNGKRILSYSSKMALTEDVPSSFEFKGRIIFTFNKVNKQDPDIAALLSRMECVELTYTRNELLNIMYKIANVAGDNLTKVERKKVTKFIEDNSTDRTTLTLRTQQLGFKYYLSCKTEYGSKNLNWQKLLGSIMQETNNSNANPLIELLTQLDTGKGIQKKQLINHARNVLKMNKKKVRQYLNEAIENKTIHTNGFKTHTIVSIKPIIE